MTPPSDDAARSLLPARDGDGEPVGRADLGDSADAGTSRGRWVAGGALGVVVLALVAVPAFWTAVLAYSAFTGCFLECTGPQPGVGLLWAGTTAALLGLPVVAAAPVVRARRRPGLSSGPRRSLRSSPDAVAARVPSVSRPTGGSMTGPVTGTTGLPAPSTARHRPWSTLLLAVCIAQVATAVTGGTVLMVVRDASFGAATAAAMISAAVPAGIAVWVVVGRRRADAGRPRTLRDAALAGFVLAVLTAVVELVSLAGVLAGVTTLDSAFGLASLLLTLGLATLAARTAATAG